jgi:hypothetical protein
MRSGVSDNNGKSKIASSMAVTYFTKKEYIHKNLY